MTAACASRCRNSQTDGGYRSMYIDQLVYFLHVAETGSMNSASQKFYMTQQAISASLKKLEAELDTSLVVRSNKGITLTPQGHIFAEYAKNIVQQYEEATLNIRRFEASEANLRGTISVFSASIFTNQFLPELMRIFTQIYPNVRIKIIEVNNDELLSYLANDYCEVALFSASKRYIEQELARYPEKQLKLLSLMEDKLVICARPDHFLAKVKSLDEKEQHAYGNDGKLEYSLYQVLSSKMQDEEIWSTCISSSSNAELHKKLIMEGVAVTYMPSLAYELEFKKDGLVSVPIIDSHPINHCLLYHDNPERENNQLIQIFRNFVESHFQKQFGVHIPVEE